MSIADFVNKVNGESLMGEFDSYAVKKVIGTGGAAKVYLVSRDGKDYAMKIPLTVNIVDDSTFPAGVGTEQNADYMKEASNWANISVMAPNDVVRLMDYNIKPFPWMVMELADGDMESAISEGTANVSDIVGLLRSLDRIHDAGLVHRDIKPGNILHVGGKWKFSDFGLAKMVSSVSLSQAMVGTPVYMAPEQVSKQFGRTDARTDIWQMGILLYHMVVGKSPYGVSDLAQLGMAIIMDGPDMDAVPEQYRGVLSKALAKEMVSRYQTAAEFADDLERCIKEGPPKTSAAAPANNGSAMDAKVEKGMEAYKGIGGVPDLREALTRFEESDDKRAIAMTAIMRALGQGTRRDMLAANMAMHKLGTDISVLGDDGDGLWIKAMLLKLNLFTLDAESDPQKLLKASSLKGSCLGAYSIFAEYPSESHLADLIFAADSGYSPAQIALGDVYVEGKFIKKSDVDAEMWYLKALKQGDPSADQKLRTLRNGGEEPTPVPELPAVDREPEKKDPPKKADPPKKKPVKQNSKEDFEKLLSRAENGDGYAQLQVAKMYESGDGCQKSESKALKWYGKAAEQGLDEALSKTIELRDRRNSRGENTPRQNEDSNRTSEPAVSSKEREFELKLSKANSGDRVAQYVVAHEYEMGQHGSVSDSEIFEWYLKSAKQDYNEAEYAVGKAYENGRGVHKSPEYAAHWYEKAANHGNVEAIQARDRLIELGLIAKPRNASNQNNAKGNFGRLLSKAEDGDANAQFRVARMYEFGDGCEKSEKNALEWYTKAAENGDQTARRKMVELRDRVGGSGRNRSAASPQKDKEFELKLSKANSGDRVAQYVVAHEYEAGKHGDVSDSEIFSWYLKSAEQDYNEAEYAVGKAYENGKGVDRSLEMAARYYDKAANHGNPEAMQARDRLAAKGVVSKPSSHEKAEPQKRPATQNSTRNGFEEAMSKAKAGSATAQFGVGSMYEKGVNVEASLDEAIRWYRKAADQGNSQAKFALKRLEKAGAIKQPLSEEKDKPAKKGGLFSRLRR